MIIIGAQGQPNNHFSVENTRSFLGSNFHESHYRNHLRNSLFLFVFFRHMKYVEYEHRFLHLHHHHSQWGAEPKVNELNSGSIG